MTTEEDMIRLKLLQYLSNESLLTEEDFITTRKDLEDHIKMTKEKMKE
jgi:hypothetical protein